MVFGHGDETPFYHFLLDRVEFTVTISIEYGVSVFIFPEKSASQKQPNLADLAKVKG